MEPETKKQIELTDDSINKQMAIGIDTTTMPNSTTLNSNCS